MPSSTRRRRSLGTSAPTMAGGTTLTLARLTAVAAVAILFLSCCAPLASATTAVSPPSARGKYPSAADALFRGGDGDRGTVEEGETAAAEDDDGGDVRKQQQRRYLSPLERGWKRRLGRIGDGGSGSGSGGRPRWGILPSPLAKAEEADDAEAEAEEAEADRKKCKALKCTAEEALVEELPLDGRCIVARACSTWDRLLKREGVPRGGALSDDEYDEYDDESSDEESEEYDEDTSESEEESESEEGESDVYDSEEEESEEEDEEEEAVVSEDVGVVEYDEMLVQSPMESMGVTVGVMLLTRKMDLTDPKMIRIARFAFVAYLILTQIFLAYVRIKAKSVDDRTEIQVQNAFSSVLQSQLAGRQDDNGAAGSDMVKNLAGSLLSSTTTVLEYDLKQAKNMSNSLLMPMAFLWFLHFKMGQVQPLLFQTASGLANLVYSPLFQCYVLGRNLERPFKSKAASMAAAANGAAEGEQAEREEEEGTTAPKVEDEDDEGEEEDEDADAETEEEEEEEGEEYSSDDEEEEEWSASDESESESE